MEGTVDINVNAASEGTAQGQAQGDGTQGAQATPAAGTQGQTNPTAAFDELLKTPGAQAEFDRRVTKALQTQATKAQEAQAAAIQKAVADALAREKMSAEEQAAHDRKQAEDALAAREAAVLKRELTASAAEKLAAKGLPATFVSMVNLTSAETVDASIEAMAGAWAPAVQGAVDSRLAGGAAPKKAAAGGSTTEEQIKAAMRGGLFRR